MSGEFPHEDSEYGTPAGERVTIVREGELIEGYLVVLRRDPEDKPVLYGFTVDGLDEQTLIRAADVENGEVAIIK